MSARLVPLLLGAALASAAYPVRLEASRLGRPDPSAELDVPKLPATTARALSFGFHSIASDLFYLEAVQVHGTSTHGVSERQLELRDAAEARLLTYAAELDPLSAGVYRFAGMALSREARDGTVHGVYEARALLEKGCAARPDDWRIPFYLGFLDSYYLGDTAAASRALRLAAAVPGAPVYLGLLAARLAADAGRLADAEAMARAMLEQSGEGPLHDEWVARLKDIDLERKAQLIEAAARRFKAATGRFPATVGELVSGGELPAVPAEPRGGRFVIDPRTGMVGSTAGRRLRIRNVPGKQAGLEVR